MANVFKLRKGLDINLKGKAAEEKVSLGASDVVRAGDALFVDKRYPEIGFASPVSGSVSAIVRGDRRKVLHVKVKADAQQQYADFGKKKEVGSMSGEDVKNALLEAGLFGYIDQLPYAVSTNPQTAPKAIFVSALRDKPLAGDFEFELKGNEHDFQTGLTALSKIAKTYLGIGARQRAEALTSARNVEINIFDGPCPAGNVGVQINHLSPVNKGEVVWTVEPTAVIFFGRLLNEGRVDLRRTVAVGGSKIVEPIYIETLVGTPLSAILKDRLRAEEHVRIINGNPLTGKRDTLNGFLGAHTSEIIAMPEGDDADEFLGWILPRTNQFSMSRSYFSWLQKKTKKYDLDARIKGGERHMIMSGEYDSVLPMDIYGEFLIKAIIAQDIDKMEQLGIYEVAPEDFALAEFVDSSKLELQRIVREGLNMLRKENA